MRAGSNRINCMAADELLLNCLRDTDVAFATHYMILIRQNDYPQKLGVCFKIVPENCI